MKPRSIGLGLIALAVAIKIGHGSLDPTVEPAYFLGMGVAFVVTLVVLVVEDVL